MRCSLLPKKLSFLYRNPICKVGSSGQVSIHWDDRFKEEQELYENNKSTEIPIAQVFHDQRIETSTLSVKP